MEPSAQVDDGVPVMGVLIKIDNRPRRARAGAARKRAAPSPWLSAGGKKQNQSRANRHENRGIPAMSWSAGFLVLTGACQFGHGVGGFATNFIHLYEYTSHTPSTRMEIRT